MIAISLDDTVEFILPQDEGKPDAERTVFTLGAPRERSARQVVNLVGENMGAFAALLQGGDLSAISGGLRLGELTSLLCCGGIRGWRNLRDGKGREIPWKGERDGSMSAELLGHFDFTARLTIAFRVLELMTVTEDERKNSP